MVLQQPNIQMHTVHRGIFLEKVVTREAKYGTFVTQCCQMDMVQAFLLI